MKVRSNVILLTLFATVACSEPPVEFADWTIPVPEGAQVIEYPAVPIEERTERIEFVEDLVIGERGDDLNYVFGRYAPKVTVDSEGRIYALSQGTSEIRVFSDEGEFLRTIGRRGQGPGELTHPVFLTVAGSTLVASDRRARKVTVWNLEGEYQHDIDLRGGPPRLSGMGIDDGTFVGRYVTRPVQSESIVVISRRNAVGEEIHRFVQAPAHAQATYAAHQSGAVYVSTVDRSIQQITAFTRDGTVRWAVRTPLTELGGVALKVAGSGNLYVFRPFESSFEHDGRLVDVYSPAGARLVAGRTSDWDLDYRWQAAIGEHVYGASIDPVSLQWRVVRYRLVEPF